MPNNNSNALVEVGLKMFLNFDYQNLDRSLNELMLELSEVFGAKATLLFRKSETGLFGLVAKSTELSDYLLERLATFCNSHGVGENKEYNHEDGTRLALLNLLVNGSNYSIAVVNGKSLSDSKPLNDIVVGLCVKKILGDVEPILTTQVIDKMTGTFCRNEYEKRYEKWKQSSEGFVVTSFVDIFSLKAMNDICGHDKGDEYIKAVARSIQEFVGNVFFGKYDADIFRYGGDEFVIAITTRTLEEAQSIEQLIATNLEAAKTILESRKDEITDKPNIITSFDHGEACGALSDIDIVVKSADEKMISNKRSHYLEIGDRRNREEKKLS